MKMHDAAAYHTSASQPVSQQLLTRVARVLTFHRHRVARGIATAFHLTGVVQTWTF
jgi:hypothetical protein